MAGLAILTSESKFSYTCGRCQQCCKTRRVYVNPFEILRLARNKGVSTTQLIDSSVDQKTFSLKREADGSCIFLNKEGCGVYADRPLACRLYPLARKKTSTEEVQYAALPPEPESTGIYGNEQTVANYLHEQDTAAYEDFSDRYFDLFSTLTTTLTAQSSQAMLGNILLEHIPVSHRLLLDPTLASDIAKLFDIEKLLFERGKDSTGLSAEAAALLHVSLTK